MDSGSSVSVRDLSITYGPHKVLDQLSLDIRQGEFLVLLGSSGCGKSTLLNAIAGLIDITDGEIWISGRNVTWEEPKDRGIGMVFQSYALYPRMTVAQNIGFGLRVAGRPRAEVEESVNKVAKSLQLEHLLNRRPAQLSGGQRQRVAIGRALVRNVDVFLFDEPLSNLDAKLRGDLRVEIKQLHQRLANTMIYVTHDQVEAMVLADRIAVMKGGVIQQLASPDEVYNRPANLFVAGFLGSPTMNFFEGRAQVTGATATFDLGALSVPLPHGARVADGQAVTMGIRPEQLTLDDGSVPGKLTGTVTVLEPTGPETIVWLDVGGQRVSVRAASGLTVKVDGRYGLTLDTATASFFDSASGDRL